MTEEKGINLIEQPELSEKELKQLTIQESRGLVSTFYQSKLELEAVKNWDKFYKRNEDRQVLMLV